MWVWGIGFAAKIQNAIQVTVAGVVFAKWLARRPDPRFYYFLGSRKLVTNMSTCGRKRISFLGSVFGACLNAKIIADKNEYSCSYPSCLSTFNTVLCYGEAVKPVIDSVLRAAEHATLFVFFWLRQMRPCSVTHTCLACDGAACHLFLKV